MIHGKTLSTESRSTDVGIERIMAKGNGRIFTVDQMGRVISLDKRSPRWMSPKKEKLN